jgi:hypothetical protein
LVLLFASCDAGNLPDVIKFKSGLYGSRQGEFVARFPDKPKVYSRHYELGQIGDYYEYVFQHRLGIEHTYNVSYIDFPDQVLKSWDIEQLFDQSIKTISSQLDEFIINERVVNTNDGYEKSITYSLFSSTPGVMMKTKLLKQGKRIYIIFFSCTRRQPNTEDIDNFLNSFQIYKPSKETN